MSKRVALLDYKIGNVKSISNAVEKLNGDILLTKDKQEILNSDAVIFPGVGAFKRGMENLQKNGLTDSIYEFIETGKPFLGICLGMQLLMDESEEFGYAKGLGLIEGSVKKLSIKEKSTDKLPHIGWNEIVEPSEGKWVNTILQDTYNGTDFYFIHTYAAYPEDKENILSLTSYGGNSFCSSVQKKNIYGTQFHPEKSGEQGLNILKNFLRLI